MKKHNAVKIVLICLAAFLLLSWILPAAYFQTSYVSQDRVQMGIFDIFAYPNTTMQYFGYIVFYVLAVGAFYGVLHHISAYRLLLDNIAKKFKNKPMICLSIIMIIFAIITSVCGAQYGLLLLYPFVISLVLLMGFDKIVAILTTVGSTCIGLIGSTFAYNNVNLLENSLSIKMMDQAITNAIVLVLGLVILIFYTSKYIKKNEKNSKVDSLDMEYYVPESINAKDSKKVKVWPLVVILDLMLLILILSLISWSSAFGLEIMGEAKNAVVDFEIGGFTLFGKLLGSVNAFGDWTLTDFTAVIVAATIALKLIYKVKFDDMLQYIINGAKRALQPAILVLLIYTGLVIVTYHPFQLVIFKAILDLTKGFNVFTAAVVAILSSFFNADMMYAMNSVVPYLVSKVSDDSVYPVIWTVFQSMYGLTMLVAPTSVVLMTTLSYLNVPIKEWIKTVWKLLVGLLVALLIVSTILVLI